MRDYFLDWEVRTPPKLISKKTKNKFYKPPFKTKGITKWEKKQK